MAVALHIVFKAARTAEQKNINLGNIFFFLCNCCVFSHHSAQDYPALAAVYIADVKDFFSIYFNYLGIKVFALACFNKLCLLFDSI